MTTSTETLTLEGALQSTKDRPTGNRKAERPTRIPLSGGYRNILTVEGQNPNFHYRWVKDNSENGGNIHRYMRAGYEFAPEEDTQGYKVEIGSELLYKWREGGGKGSLRQVFRQPASRSSDDGFLYLMRIPMEYYEEDRAALEAETNSRHRQLRGDFGEGNSASDYYGSINIGEMEDHKE